MTLTPKDKILVMDFPNSLGSAEGTRYFFWQLYDFPSRMKRLPLLRAYEQTLPSFFKVLLGFGANLISTLPGAGWSHHLGGYPILGEAS